MKCRKIIWRWRCYNFFYFIIFIVFVFVFYLCSTECPSKPISLSGSGTISSPNYPGSNYPSSRSCEWIIEAMAGRRVMVNIRDFALGTCNGCGSTTTCSRVEFYDGPTKNSPLLERFCSGSSRKAVISSGVQLFVRFESGFSPDRGFQADYAEISGTATTGGLRWLHLFQPRSQGYFPKKMGRAGNGPGIGRSHHPKNTQKLWV